MFADNIAHKTSFTKKNKGKDLSKIQETLNV